MVDQKNALFEQAGVELLDFDSMYAATQSTPVRNCAPAIVDTGSRAAQGTPGCQETHPARRRAGLPARPRTRHVPVRDEFALEHRWRVQWHRPAAARNAHGRHRQVATRRASAKARSRRSCTTRPPRSCASCRQGIRLDDRAGRAASVGSTRLPCATRAAISGAKELVLTSLDVLQGFPLQPGRRIQAEGRHD